jgi:uncharacterized protein (TIGR02246 family)
MMKRFAITLALITLALAPAGAQTSTTQDEAAIRATIEVTLPERINAADAKGVAALWSEKGSHGGLVANARIREGRDSVEQMWASGFAQPSRDPARKVSVSILGIRFLRPDVVAVDARNAYHGGVSAAGILRPDTGELMFVVLMRESGTWTIASSRVVPLISSSAR